MYPEMKEKQKSVGVANDKNGLNSMTVNNGGNLNGNEKEAEVFSMSQNVAKSSPAPEAIFRYRASKDSPPDENGMNRGVVLNPFHFFRSRESSWSPQGNGTVKAKEMTQKNIVANDSIPSGKSTDHLIAKPQKMSLCRKISFWFSFLPIIGFVLFLTVILPCEYPGASDLCIKNSTNASAIL